MHNIDRFCDTAGAPSAIPPNLNFLGDDSTLYYNSYDEIGSRLD